ncbi:MAG TPA: SpaA isopeptide-forming pilin-related protein, partial [Nitrososphaera sp.]|nr:SpaA isopeptide-forming pilin-related protein [Nitrososphaera sp.]
MSSHRLAVIASIVAAAATISAVFLVLQSQNLLTIFAANSSSSNAGKLTIISVSGSLLTNQSTYVISPDPFGNFANYTIHDGSSADKNNAAGIVEISGLPEGRYLVAQTQASSQYATDKLSKTVEVMNQSRNGVAMFNNISWQEG